MIDCGMARNKPIKLNAAQSLKFAKALMAKTSPAPARVKRAVKEYKRRVKP
jgi:hypothetical protein